jgi:hypothetical protein
LSDIDSRRVRADFFPAFSDGELQHGLTDGVMGWEYLLMTARRV